MTGSLCHFTCDDPFEVPRCVVCDQVQGRPCPDRVTS